MQPISSYATEANFLRVVLQGPSGSGKTTLSSQFPGAAIVDVDVNLGGPLRTLKRLGKPLPVGYAMLDYDEDGKPVPLAQRYQRLDKVLIDFQTQESVKTIVIASATKLVDVLIAETLRQQGKPSIESFKDGRQFWNFFAQVCRVFLETLTRMRKHIVLETHEKINKNEMGALVYPIKVNWPGQIGQVIGSFFTDVWRAETEVNGTGINATYKFFIRTMPDMRYELKNGLGLPALFEFNWATIQAALDATAKP